MIFLAFMLLVTLTVNIFIDLCSVYNVISTNVLSFSIFAFSGLCGIAILYFRLFLYKSEEFYDNKKELKKDFNSNIIKSKDEQINLFDKKIIKGINEVISNLSLNNKTDYAILFLYVQHSVLKIKISNKEMLRQIEFNFKIKTFANSYYGQVANNLFEWKDKSLKIKEVKEVYYKSPHYERYKQIEENYKF